ncbi:acyltransferase family protein [Urbifossiella limnaea]|uniref:Acyltransferase family protein n=1 Tax=Urbifossiella limnaea TaxID=2528023 RepID=A0A517XYL1_9BACT|nr:acyltransferase [Urbifossiella limnaea]QDU22596.1 Acyltransferase family protein [Urbifossiella limnaea]
MTARYRTLDAWRGLACLMVVVSHATVFASHVPGVADNGIWGRLVGACGWMVVGVPLFFVISGYCIAATADATIQRGGSVGGYFARRFRRIFPPYLMAVALVAAFALVVERGVSPGLVGADFGPIAPVPDPATLSPLQWLTNLTLTESWRPLIDPSRPNRYQVGPAWTLCYEEQFYAVTGVVLLLARRWFFAGCLAVTAVVVGGVLTRWNGVDLTGTFLDGRWLMFAAGVGVYWAVTRGGRRRNALMVAALVAGLAYSLREPARFLDTRFYDPVAEPREQAPAFAFALLLLALKRWDGGIAASGVGKRLGAVGAYSYSLYLVHYPICITVGHLGLRAGGSDPRAVLFGVVPVCVVLSLVVAKWFHARVESKWLPDAKSPGTAVPGLSVSPTSDLSSCRTRPSACAGAPGAAARCSSASGSPGSR